MSDFLICEMFQNMNCADLYVQYVFKQPFNISEVKVSFFFIWILSWMHYFDGYVHE